MKTITCILFIVLFGSLSKAKEVHFKNLPANTFFAHLSTNLDSLYENKNIKNTIKQEYLSKELNHYLVDNKRNMFDTYWELYKNSWHTVDLNNDGELEYIFQGKYESDDKQEYTEIYKQQGAQLKLIYLEEGEIKAYQTNPFTGEVILYTHEYPCCEKYIHNIVKLRLVKGKIHEKKKVFFGRETKDMQGPFFVDTFKNEKNYALLDGRKTLYWSDSIINNNAFKTVGKVIASNKICSFPKGTPYKVVGYKNNWCFVLITGLAIDEKSLSINTKNIEYTPIYGWMHLEDL